jgi:hypothetical protein
VLTLGLLDVSRAGMRGVNSKMLSSFSTQYMLKRNSLKFFSQIQQILRSSMASSLKSIAETPETMTEVDVHGTSDGQPVKAHKLTRDRLKTGRASMFPLVLDPPSKRARLNLAADAPPLPPMPAAGRNASCTSTFPGKNQRPPAWSGADQGGEWRPYDSPYGQPYDDDAHYNESWHRESHRRPAPHYNDWR